MDQPIDKYLPIFRTQLDKLVVFNDEEWAVFTKHLSLKSLLKKECFTQSGEICKEVGFIISGSVRFYYIKNGEEVTNYFCMDNEFISSYKSF